MRLRPAPIPTMAVAAALGVLLNLGAWQLRRHAEARDAGLLVEARQALPALGAGELTGPDTAWRRAELEGAWLDVPPALILGRYVRGVPGYEVVSALRLPTGEVALVDRGWVSSEGFDPAVVSSAAPARVRGLVLPVDGDPELRPLGDDDAPRWPPGSHAAIARAWEIAPVALVVAGDPVASADAKPAGDPLVTGYVARPRGLPHLEYAGTWFGIAVVLAALWVYGSLRPIVSDGDRAAPG